MTHRNFQILPVRTWHLKYNRDIPKPDKNYTTELWINPDIEEYLSLYKNVGNPWGWTGRLLLSPNELKEKLNSPSNEIWLFKQESELLGFFEIDKSNLGTSEIVYLGLLPNQVGKGYGKSFLDAAIATAIGKNNSQVWLHTCEFDHPKALEIYLKAGFVIHKETVEQEYYPKDFLPRQ